MISMRRITCTNITDDVSVTFGDRFSPFLLQDVEGIYSIDVNINSTDNSMFEFPHYYIKEGEELAVRVTKQLVEIQNDSSADGIGLTITMTTNQPVINPRMYHVESDSFIQLGDDNNEFNMQIGDQVIFTTENNNKNAYLIRDGVKTIINEHISDDSEYIQLTHGTNHLRYSAKEGEEHLLVNVTFRMKYQGV